MNRDSEGNGLAAGTPVRVKVKLESVEISFEPGFTREDVAAVKAIPGRRRRPRRRVWIVPRGVDTVRALEERFGARIVCEEAEGNARKSRLEGQTRPQPVRGP